MRKSGWAATGLASLVMLLAACGGSSGSSASGTGATPTTTADAGGHPSGAALNPAGTVVLIVQKSAVGWVLAKANGYVVYTYGKDTKGGKPTCTGSCAAMWTPLTGLPRASQAVNLPGTLGTVSTADGAKQVTYNGMPLYLLKGAKPLYSKGNGMDGGLWHVVKMSASDIKSY